MASNTDDTPAKLEFDGGFELYLPPTPFCEPPQPPGFVMLDDQDNIFYRVDYGNPLLRHTTSWHDLALHKVPDPAIIFPPYQFELFLDPNTRFGTGFLVSITSRSQDVFTAVKLGAVNVSPLPKEHMNWTALRKLKGPELPAEMAAGLMRRVFDRRPGRADHDNIPYVTSADILDDMPRPWHRDGQCLNEELDFKFGGGARFTFKPDWRILAK